MPVGAGLIVAYLQSWGFSPALKFLTRAIEGVVDDSKNAALPTSYWQVRTQQATEPSSRRHRGSTCQSLSQKQLSLSLQLLSSHEPYAGLHSACAKQTAFERSRNASLSHLLCFTSPPGCVALQVFRRALASVITLGSGASLGPEAPSVELGANTAAVFAPKHLSKRRQRMLVAAGAAAGEDV